MKFVGTGTLKYKDLAIYSQTMSNYADRVNALKENSLQNAKAEKNTVTGNITVDKDKMLVVTLPYQKGWTAYVDGKKTDIQRVNYQYIGINLKKGTHDIKLHYQLPGIKLAFMINRMWYHSIWWQFIIILILSEKDERIRGFLIHSKKNYFVKEEQNAIKEMPGQIWRWKAALSEVMKQARYNAFLLKGCSEHK